MTVLRVLEDAARRYYFATIGNDDDHAKLQEAVRTLATLGEKILIKCKVG